MISERIFISSALVDVQLNISAGHLVQVLFHPNGSCETSPKSPTSLPFVAAIEAYLCEPSGQIELPYATNGTPFQQRVWQILRAIPAGETLTYGDIAKRLKTSPRAVGGACRRNPIPLVIPCHRVVASKHIGGFLGKENVFMLDVKRRLLEHERIT